jgi:hypothetical protein
MSGSGRIRRISLSARPAAGSEQGDDLVDDHAVPGARADLAPQALHHLVDAVLEDAEYLEDRLDACDAYVVLVTDPATGAIDSYGPFDGTSALLDAARRRRGLDEGDLTDVAVTVVRHHRPDAADDGSPSLAS